MCRLTAYAGEPLAADTLVFGGTHSLFEQSYVPRELLHGHVNADGYGVVWYRDSTVVRTGSVRPIWQDEDLRTLLEGVSSSTILAAVRNATPGIPLEGGNLPLVHERWSFILNGFVENFCESHMRTLRSHLPDDLYGRLAGSSDSETLFMLAVAAIQSGASRIDALRRVRDLVLETVRAENHTAQLTMVLADEHGIGVLHTGSENTTNSLYLAHGHPLAPGGALLASERLDDDTSWEPLVIHEEIELVSP
jgi:glutamine amidotransferase